MFRDTAALLALVLCSCASRYQAVPTFGYIRSLDNFGNARGAASVGVEFWPVSKQEPLWLAADRHRRMARPVTGREGSGEPTQAPSVIPKPDKGTTVPDTELPESAKPDSDDDVTITGSFGVLRVSQELMKFLLLPLLMGGYVWNRRRLAVVQDDTPIP